MNQKRTTFVLLCCAVVLSVNVRSASAQFGGRIDRPINRPTVSPYINLFRNNNNASGVLNYYGLVRPQLDQQRANQQFGQNLQQLQYQQGLQRSGLGVQQQRIGYSQLGTTGHPTTFMSFSGGGGAAIGGGIGGGGQFAGGGIGGGALSGGLGNNLPSVGGFSSGGSVGGVSGSQVGSSFASPGFSAGGSLTGHPAVFGTGAGVGAGSGF